MSLTPNWRIASSLMLTLTDRYAPVPAASAHGRCAERTVWRWLAAGVLTRYRAGHRTLVDLDELDKILTPRPA